MDSAWRLLIDLAVLLILVLGIARFRAPQTARSGNLLAAFALLCAMGAVFYANPVRSPATVVLALAAGGAAGCLAAVRANMLQIPAMVAFQHGAGGIAALLTSFVELARGRGDLVVGQVSGVLGMAIGAATFSGSMIAAAKLAGVVRQTPVVLPKHNWILAASLAGVGALGGLAVLAGRPGVLYGAPALALLSIFLGAVFAVRIGGADMPVLISFLNATAGLAASFCGIIVENRLLIAGGATVAASGSILTHVMCQAMNRSLFKVLVAAEVRSAAAVSAGGATPAAPPAPRPAAEPEPSGEEAALARAVGAARNAKSVIVVPGYGMALAHAQFEVARLAERLRAMGKEVRFAIHPIAGRMPGHMHVLLAEAEADPDLLFDLREINADFQKTDLALVVGACDVVNPAAIHVKGTPISGMPILAAHEAKQVVVCNKDEKPGYSGVENPLYAEPKTILLFGDAKATLGRLLEALG